MTASINCFINADMFSCTWGTFATICFTVYNLPPRSQAVIHDVAEAYCTVPIGPDQWPGLVIKLLEDDEFAINTCNNFGLTLAGEIYSKVALATLDIFYAQGIGPASRLVDNHIFFHVPGEHHIAYNIRCHFWHDTIMHNGGCHLSGSWFWYQGECMLDSRPAEFDEDAASPISNYSHIPNRSHYDLLFTYCDADIDLISEQLGIPWEPSKTFPFSSIIPYLGFDWNLPEHTVTITDNKRAKYSSAINNWLSHPTHDLEETQKLYGMLLHTSLVLLAG